VAYTPTVAPHHPITRRSPRGYRDEALASTAAPIGHMPLYVIA